MPAVLLFGAHTWIALLCVYSLAFATHFTFHFEPLHFMDQFRSLANGLAHLHVYVADKNGSPPGNCIDCSTYHEKAYVPYPPAPAFIQLVLVNFLETRVTDGAIVWAICAISLYAMFWISRWYAQQILGLSPRSAIYAGMAAVAVVGTTNIFLHVSTVPYAWSQACAAGQLLNLLSAFLLIRAVYSGNSRGIFWSGVLCALSFLCKQNYVPAVLAGCAYLLWTGHSRGWTRSQNIRRVLSFSLPVVVGIGLLLLYNYARYDSALDTGLEYLNTSDKHPEPYQMPQPHRIPYNLYNHFLAGVEIRTSDFPFVLGQSSDFGGINHKDGSGGLLHNFHNMSVFISMPMLLLVIPGLFYAVALLVRRRSTAAWDSWIYLVVLWCCVFFYYLNETGSFVRFEYDMPFLLGLCVMQVVVFVWRALGRLDARPLRSLLQGGFALLLMLCFVEQALLGADQTAGLILTRTDKFLWWQAAERDSDVRIQARAQAVREALFSRQPTMDATQNVQQTGRVTLRVRLPAHPANGSEPLLQLGDVPGSADMLGVRYTSDGHINLVFDHWGSPPCVSSPQLPSSEREQSIEVALDPARGRAAVSFNGKAVMDCKAGVFRQALNTHVVGKNTLGFTTVGQMFSGSVVEVLHADKQ
ncbi:MAG: hypothetical protein JO061_08080 [Acidobacteriaceae bacterium]|nr:hypothetical protein [Acidobacteriaceae bacterium]